MTKIRVSIAEFLVTNCSKNSCLLCRARHKRHACANHLQASGFSLKQIGDHLGHRTSNSTLCYTKIDLEGLRQVAELDLGEVL